MRNESFLLFFAAVAAVAFTLNQVLKWKYPDRADMWLVDIFLGLMVVTLLGLVFPDLLAWVHFTLEDYRDPSRH